MGQSRYTEITFRTNKSAILYQSRKTEFSPNGILSARAAAIQMPFEGVNQVEILYAALEAPTPIHPIQNPSLLCKVCHGYRNRLIYLERDESRKPHLTQFVVHSTANGDF